MGAPEEATDKAGDARWKVTVYSLVQFECDELDCYRTVNARVKLNARSPYEAIYTKLPQYWVLIHSHHYCPGHAVERREENDRREARFYDDRTRRAYGFSVEEWDTGGLTLSLNERARRARAERR